MVEAVDYRVESVGWYIWPASYWSQKKKKAKEILSFPPPLSFSLFAFVWTHIKHPGMMSKKSRQGLPGEGRVSELVGQRQADEGLGWVGGALLYIYLFTSVGV